MKKIFIIITLLLGLFLIPNVYAAELPREGVTYFMTYPNNEEVVTEDYDEAVSEPERLIYEGTTDTNGQITITGLGNQGDIRITGNGEEIKVNLTNQRTAEIKEKKLVNPKTGASLIFIIALVAGLTVVTINSKKKKVLLVVPLLLVVTLLSNVKAESEDFVVTLKNSLGQPISGKVVKVYAKPIKVEGTPAIKFDANGGKFYNGEAILYIKLPNNGCNLNDVFNYWYETDTEYYKYLRYAPITVVREGYTPYYNDLSDTYSNGNTIKVNWDQNEDAQIVTFHGNGGTVTFNGTTFNELKLYNGQFPLDLSELFSNGGMFFKGIDDNNQCSNYQGGNIPRLSSILPDDVYLCWETIEDGIYINDELIVPGYSDDACPSMTIEVEEDSYSFNTNKYDSNHGHLQFFVDDINTNSLNFHYYYYIPYNQTYNAPSYYQPQVYNIMVVKNGKIIVNIGNNDITKTSDQNASFLTVFTVNNATKSNLLNTYLTGYYEKGCVSEITPPIGPLR